MDEPILGPGDARRRVTEGSGLGRPELPVTAVPAGVDEEPAKPVGRRGPRRLSRAAGVALVALAVALVLGGYVWVQTRTPDATADRERLARLRNGQYLLALNVYNNAAILPAFAERLLALATFLGPQNLFISVFENGSTDETPALLEQLSGRLERHGVRHYIRSEARNWQSLCSDLPPPTSHAEAHIQQVCSTWAAKSLRSAPSFIRIPLMALVRNYALAPIWDVLPSALEKAMAGRNATVHGERRWRPDPSRPSSVLFLNDVLWELEDVAALIDTRRGDYDMACAMDFEELKFYDGWVARDMSGRAFDDYYPFVREPRTSALLRANEPFPVYSCWNGGVVMNLTLLLQGGIQFRSWREFEVRSLHPQARQSQWFDNHHCTASECHLICKDLWAAPLTRGIFMNPRVQLTYNRMSWWLQRLLMPILNHGFFAWANRVDRDRPFLRGHRGDTPLAVPWNGILEPPAYVTCGICPDEGFYPDGPPPVVQNATDVHGRPRSPWIF